MSIAVKEIIKEFGEQKALNNVSFEIESGKIVGFLGPNGAGKSTMMKIITCFLPPTSGSVTVNGYNIYDDPILVKSSIGYLPEHNPLYLDMYVKEYLQFIAGVHKLDNIKNRVEEIIEITGLTLERKKVIGALSKGYRQRVGIAQALIHDPKVLILDEPTSGLDPNQLVEIRELISTNWLGSKPEVGLDPNQLVEIRELIKNISIDKTIMLSTHIMQEVEAICDNVIIINKGKIIANDSTDNISKVVSSSISITVEFDIEVNKSELEKISKVESVEFIGDNKWILKSLPEHDIRSDVFNFAVENDYKVLSLILNEDNLENTFQKLTNQ